MRKKIICLALAAALLWTASGCALFIEDEYAIITQHVQTSEEPVETGTETLEVEDYDQLVYALLQLVKDYQSYGILRFGTYEGDLESDLDRACMAVSNETPLGAYAVSYLRAELNRIVSYYEAEVYITFKKSITAMNSIKTVTSAQSLRRELSTVMQQYGTNLAVLTDDPQITQEIVAQTVASIYYSDPSCSIYLPRVSVTFYPEEAAVRIADITLEYPYTYSQMNSRERSATSSARTLSQATASLPSGEAYLALCQNLSEAVAYDPSTEETDDYDRWEAPHNVYGAFVQGSASSEGLALAYKLLCDLRGLDCYVVRGRYKNMTHTWNIIQLEGDYYHVDVSRIREDGILDTFLQSDSDMAEDYWWNTEVYPVCDGNLTFYDIAGYGPVN